MAPEYNDLGPAIGSPLSNGTPPLPLPRQPIEGRYCRLVPPDPDRQRLRLSDMTASFRKQIG